MCVNLVIHHHHQQISSSLDSHLAMCVAWWTEEKVYIDNNQLSQHPKQLQQPTRHQKWAIIGGVAALLFIFDGLQVSGVCGEQTLSGVLINRHQRRYVIYLVHYMESWLIDGYNEPMGTVNTDELSVNLPITPPTIVGQMMDIVGMELRGEYVARRWSTMMIGLFFHLKRRSFRGIFPIQLNAYLVWIETNGWSNVVSSESEQCG